MPPAFSYTCPDCGHTDFYERRDLSYQDEAIGKTSASKRCDAAEQARAHGA
jgi:hypothetical protein